MTVSHPVGIDVTVEVFWDNASWYDISDDVRVMTLQTSQRQRLRNDFDPGSLVLQLDNSSRTYDPLYADGPYYGYLKPNRQIRVTFDSATSTRTDQVWWGVTDRFAIDFDRSNRDSVVTLTCRDAMGVWAMSQVPFGYLTSDVLDTSWSIIQRANTYTGISSYLPNSTGPGWGTPIARFSNTWDDTVDHNVLEEVRRLMDVEQGYMASQRNALGVYLYARNWFLENSRSVTSQFSVGAGGLPVQQISPLFDSDEIITAVSMTDDQGNGTVSIDTAGESTYGPRYPAVNYSSLPALETEYLTGAAAAILAVRATEEFRIDQLVIKPASDPDWLTWAVDVDLLDRVTVTYTPLSTGDPVTGDYFVDGITHQITPGDWTMSLSLMQADRYDAAASGDIFAWGSSLVGGSDVIGL